MQCGKFERWMMGTRSRKKAQVKETIELKVHSELSSYSKVLEVGCGNGYGQQLIEEYFKPEDYTGIDLDDKEIAKAKKRQVESSNVRFEVGDTTGLQFKDSTYDTVFNYGSFHHIANWKKGLEEVYRVMKPGAEFLCMDFDITSFENMNFIKRFFFRRWMPHPYETMYTQEEFISHLESLNMEVTYHNPHFIPARNMDYFAIIAKKS